MRIGIGLAALAFLAGCATLSKEECLNGDWREIGQRDGQAGRTASFIAQHAKACEKTGVVPNQSLWEQGRQAGLPAYCTVSKVYAEGQAGRSLSPVCLASQLPALQAAHDKGRAWKRLTSEIDSKKREIVELRSKILTEDDKAQRAVYMANIQRIQAEILLLESRRRSRATL